MQNLKFKSVFILTIMFAYFLFSQVYLVSLGNIYTYIINPLFFIFLMLALRFYISVPHKTHKYSHTILQYVLITVLIYTVIYLLSGLMFDYGKNPYYIGIKGFLLNLYSIGAVVYCKEFIRYKVINNVLKKDRILVCVLTIIIYTIQDIPTIDFSNGLNLYYLFKIFSATLIPSLAKNCLLTYISLYTNYITSFVYEFVMYLVLWVPPLLPNTPWIYTAILNIIFPIILLIYCIYYVASKEKIYRYNSRNAIDPKGLIPFAAVIIVFIWFAIGIFPIKPVGVASGSMAPYINKGDYVIIKKCNMNDIDVGTVVEYSRKDFTVIHRVIEKKQINGEYFIKTKGDNNQDPDSDEVKEDQIEGKVIAKIPYLAYPRIWIDEMIFNSKDVDIQMGK